MNRRANGTRAVLATFLALTFALSAVFWWQRDDDQGEAVRGRVPPGRGRSALRCVAQADVGIKDHAVVMATA